jgi:threonine dehydrogenase-like Zn-dependent dehydrogenase
VLGPRAVGCAPSRPRAPPGAAHVIAIDGVDARLDVASAFGAAPVHLTEQDPRAASRPVTEARGSTWPSTPWVTRARSISQSAWPRAAAPVSVVGVYAERAEVHMGLAWIKALTLHTGQANVIGHLDRVLALMSAGVLDPGRSSPTT